MKQVITAMCFASRTARSRTRIIPRIFFSMEYMLFCFLVFFLFINGSYADLCVSVAHVNAYSTSGSGADNESLDEKFDQHKVGALATTDLIANNSQLKGAAQVVMDNSKHLFKLGVSAWLDTGKANTAAGC